MSKLVHLRYSTDYRTGLNGLNGLNEPCRYVLRVKTKKKNGVINIIIKKKLYVTIIIYDYPSSLVFTI